MSDVSLPVVIAGAGPVGLSMAIGLARRGVPTVVLESKTALSDHSRAILVSCRTCEILHEWGLLETFKANSIWTEELAPVDALRNRPILSFSFKVLEPISVGHGVCLLAQDETERLLLAACLASELVDVRFGHRVARFVSSADHVRVAVESDAGTYELVSRYLCGCDGAHSVVRDGLGFHLEGKTYGARAALADVLIADERDKLAGMRANFRTPQVSFAIRFTTGRWRIIFLARGSTDEAVPEPSFVQARVNELIGPGPCEILWSSYFKIHCRNAQSFRVGRVCLLGDAGHLNSPAGGMGMNAGIHDAHNLAWKIARILDGADEESLLRSYDDERSDAVRNGVDVATDRLTSVGIRFPAWARTTALTVAGIVTKLPAVRRRFAMGAGMLTHRYKGSPLIDPSGGRIMPDVLLADDSRLRERLGVDGGLVEFDPRTRRVTFGGQNHLLSAPGVAELKRAGGPIFAVRPDSIVAYSGSSRERATTMLAAFAPSEK